MDTANIKQLYGPKTLPGVSTNGPQATVLCSWARHLTLTVPLSLLRSTWVATKCWATLKNARK